MNLACLRRFTNRRFSLVAAGCVCAFGAGEEDEGGVTGVDIVSRYVAMCEWSRYGSAQSRRGQSVSMRKYLEHPRSSWHHVSFALSVQSRARRCVRVERVTVEYSYSSYGWKSLGYFKGHQYQRQHKTMKPSIARSTAAVRLIRPRLTCHGSRRRILVPSPPPPPPPLKHQPTRPFSSQRTCFKSKTTQDDADNDAKLNLAGQSDEASADRARYASSLSTLLRSSNKDIHMSTSTHTVPSELYEMTFARSSGAGGQNVNKLNTKAVLRFFLGKAQETRIANVYQSESALQKSILPLPMPKSVAKWIAERSVSVEIDGHAQEQFFRFHF